MWQGLCQCDTHPTIVEHGGFKERQVNLDGGHDTRRAMHFVLLVGALSLFADFTYEGARSILGPFLASLGASATVIGIVAGLGELMGYGLRIVSGAAADATRRFWPIAIGGYVVQMASVPALAFVQSWQAAACLIVLERVGKAIRNPPRDVMLSSAGQHIGGYGWAFGIHEACDQFGAMVGPLVVAAVLARHGDYAVAFATLAIPAAINLTLLMAARLVFPRPEDMELPMVDAYVGRGFPVRYWAYLAGAGLVAAGFADYSLIAYHWVRSHTLTVNWIPVFYAVAMAISGSASLVFGRLFDRFGFRLLILLTAVSLLFAPLVFLGDNVWFALAGAIVWGMGIGVHESIIPAAVAPMVAQTRRASAFGTFTAVYGTCWFAGSALIGWIYDHHVTGVVIFSLATQTAAIPIFAWVSRREQE
ncbi:MFS transporter [Burkholderia ambifaria]|uniref:MFS transporter n=1 Tax=Burkholderia ambifaria TaxID=152480 RepID=UPI001FC8A3A4|nr:MFS transporter [Burkholderia ambifaria]